MAFGSQDILKKLRQHAVKNNTPQSVSAKADSTNLLSQESVEAISADVTSAGLLPVENMIAIEEIAAPQGSLQGKPKPKKEHMPDVLMALLKSPKNDLRNR